MLLLATVVMFLTLSTPTLEHVKGKRNISSDNSLNNVNKNLVGKSYHSKGHHVKQHRNDVNILNKYRVTSTHPETWALKGKNNVTKIANSENNKGFHFTTNKHTHINLYFSRFLSVYGVSCEHQHLWSVSQCEVVQE